MKNTAYKLLGILVSLTIVFSSFAAAISVSANSQVGLQEYFVKAGATAGNGTEQLPFGNIAQAVSKAVNDGCVAEQAVAVIILDDTAVAGADTVEWGIVPEYAFDLTVKSKTVAANIALPAETCFTGNIEFANVTVNAGGSWPSRKVYFGGHNVKFGADASLNTDYAAYGNKNGNVEFSQQSVEFLGNIKTNPTYIYLSNEVNGIVKRNGDVNINLGHANGVIAPSSNYGSTTFAKNVNIDFTNLSTSKLQDFGSAGGWTISGAVQIICKNNFTLTNEQLLQTYSPVGGVYKIINKTGLNKLLEFVPETAGKYKIVADTDRFIFTVKDSVGTEYPIQTEGSEKYIALPTGGGTFTVTMQKQAETKDYYISATGVTGNDGTAEKPFLTVAEAVAAANEYGMTVGDTVNIMILGEEKVDWGTVAAYSFNMTVKASDPTVRATLYLPEKTALSGDVEFENVELQADALLFNDKNVIFGIGTEYSAEYPAFGTASTPSTVDGQTVIYRGKINTPYTKITNDMNGKKTYTDDVNIVVDNGESNIGFYVKSNYGETVYEENANLNIDIKNASAIRFIDVGGTITHKGAIQIINKKGFEIVGKEHINSAAPTKGVYWITNSSGNENLLEFTDTVGKYKINSEYDVIVTSSDFPEGKKVEGEYLLLDKPGEYEVGVDRPIITKDYFVSGEGIEIVVGERPATAGTKDNPVKTIADVTRLIAQDNLSAMDTANIILPNDEKIDWGDNAVGYVANVIIQSEVLGAVAEVVTDRGIVFTGNTHFKSVRLEQEYMHGGVAFGHYDVVIDENSSIASNYISIGTIASPGKVTKDQKIEVYGVVNASEFKLATGYGNTTYENNIDITVDNSQTDFNIRLGATTGTTTNYNGKINLYVPNANTISYNKVTADANVNINGDIQLIVGKDVRVTPAVKINFNDLEVNGGKWYITNYSDTPDLIGFGENAGEFVVKDNKKVYIRQYEVEKMEEVTGGLVTLDSGEYVISDQEIPYLYNDLHKMLYFRNSGGLEDLYVRVPVTAGETYRFEYSIWASRYEDLKPIVKQNGDYRWTLADATIISEEKVENYYKVVCEVVVPEDYAYPTAFFGVELYPFNEGYLFDVSVYDAKDKQKTNIMPNNNFYSGLDYWALGYSFWGAIFAGEKGGVGRLEYVGNGTLRVESFSIEVIQALIDACSPNDGEWWDEDQIKKEELYVAYIDSVKGNLTDDKGVPLKDCEILLVSADKSYSAFSDKKGNFAFSDEILSGFYELFVVTPDGEKHYSGYSRYIDEYEELILQLVVNYAVKTETAEESESPIVEDVFVTDNTATTEDMTTDVSESEQEETQEENMQAVGALLGTVYTPFLETVSGLKIYLGDIGQVVSDKDGKFAFSNVPVGDYLLYTVLANGEQYALKEVTISQDTLLEIRVKYDPAVETESEKSDNGWVVWIIVASIVALVIAAGVIVLLFVKKKKE